LKKSAAISCTAFVEYCTQRNSSLTWIQSS